MASCAESAISNIADCALFGSRVCVHCIQASTDQELEIMGERAPLLARAVGGKVLGPRPGLAIVSFWQGILEIILRALALVSHTSDRHHATTKLARLQIYGCHVSQGGIDYPYLYPFYSLV